jgi:hypothetical protein
LAECKGGLKIRVQVEFVEADQHYVIKPQVPGAVEGGRAGLGGTTSMTGWGVKDPIDVVHEFGHMLGNPESYFVINGIDKGAARRLGFNVMNDPAGPVIVDNFAFVVQQINEKLKLNCKASRDWLLDDPIEAIRQRQAK